MNGRLSRFEQRMEALVEGTFARLFSGRVHPRDVALRLARALEDSAAAGAPATHYTVRLNPADAEALLSVHPGLAATLAAELLNLARDAGVTLAQAPEVSLKPDASQKPQAVLVLAESRGVGTHATQSMPAVQFARPRSVPRAFVILEGERTVELSEPVVNLGRRFDNQIILDDPRVSRNHAQLRLRFGRYVLYDLGSTGGTLVNGKRVDECVLRPGDVISLGGVPIIYGEDGAEPQLAPDAAGSLPLHNTRPMRAPEGLEQPDDLPPTDDLPRPDDAAPKSAGPA